MRITVAPRECGLNNTGIAVLRRAYDTLFFKGVNVFLFAEYGPTEKARLLDQVIRQRIESAPRRFEESGLVRR